MPVIHNSIRKLHERILMKEKMSRWGVGPVFALLSISYATIMLAIHFYFHPVFRIGFMPDRLTSIIGFVLTGCGVLFYILSVKAVARAYNADELVTDGIFRWCRHPLYASWVVFIVPGIALLVKSWIVLTTPLFMYFIVRTLVKKEEAYLESMFGSKYRDYKRDVPCILPYGVMKQVF